MNVSLSASVPSIVAATLGAICPSHCLPLSRCAIAALKKNKPMWAVMAHWETGSGHINDVQGFSQACEAHGVLGIVDAVSSLGIADFIIDDYPGVVAWASCPQKEC